MRWPFRHWTKPVYRRSKRNFRGYFSPFTPKKFGASGKFGPVSVTDSGRVYVFGARVW